MPYLRTASQEQVSRGQASGTVRLQWVFGNLIPDLIGIRQPGSNATPVVFKNSISLR